MCAVYVPITDQHSWYDEIQSIPDYDTRLVPGVTIWYRGKNWILKTITRFDGTYVAGIEDEGGDSVAAWMDSIQFVCYFNNNDVECVE